MAIGERIRFFRNLRGMTQKALGMAVGFPEQSADIRIAQYESGTRTPKPDLTSELARILGVSSQALNVPDINNHIALAHTLFVLEDTCGLSIKEKDSTIYLEIDLTQDGKTEEMESLLTAWKMQAAKLDAGEISREEYDQWRYQYPESDATYPDKE